MDDLLSEFLTETAESLATLDIELVNLEQNPNDTGILSNIFRLVHTIKGTCGFLGLPRLESLAHSGENVLGKFRDGELTVTAEAVTLILASIDRIKELLGHLEANETEPEGNDRDLIDQLNAMAEGNTSGGGAPAAAAPPPPPTPAPEAPPAAAEAFPVAAELLAEVQQAVSQGKKATSQAELDAQMAAERAKEAASAKPAPAAEEPAAAPPEAEKPAAAKPPAAAKEPPKEAAKAAAPAAPAGGGGGGGENSIAAQSIRVNVDLLENLMTLVSELVLTRNQLLQMIRGRDDSEFAAPLQRLSHITSDLQEGVMKTRMQPIGNAWSKLPRIVRDLGIETGKKIDLQMYGAETELDRQVLELIKDPLTHMVRNSADHGLEDTEGRRNAGKSEVGIIKLNAFHEGGHIIIEISDDGRGLNINRIREKAIANGLASEADLDSMNEQQIAQFIFKAGFSTAEKITSVSGRGVGMDVVRTNIEKIGGTIELKTIYGKGTTFTIKIPLTLAIVSALIVECAAERFAIPQISVLELVRVTANSETKIEKINRAPVLRLRDRLLPLVSLGNLLKLRQDDIHDLAARLADVDNDLNETFIVVTQVGTYTFGIIVDRVFDTEEIVVKPVAPILRHISMFSGNTILGDGSVIMILDPNGIATATGEVTMNSAGGEGASAYEGTRVDDMTSLLIFRAATAELKAVPLALVARLEEIELEKVEYSFGKPVVQYRGQLMPLVTVTDGIEFRKEGRQPILVFSDRDRSMGLMVDEIVDIVEDRLKVELKAETQGIIGTAIIGDRATDVIDTGYYLTRAFGDWFGKPQLPSSQDRAAAGGPSVLLVDDSPFFRNLLTPLLSVSGYDVTTVDSAEKAMAILNSGARFDAVVSDIEMPGMNGFEFAEALRKDERFATIPLIALSSRATERDLERGREVGFDDYVAKFDRDALINTLGQILGAAAA
ncbi:hybrid sensor histidine kinase/response regulator [Haematospirillum jordaniae]|uniref:Chemotaxis protein CheA n=1 Tax=Haematospirillum jordaniae TaxID=1549855 RepID=A0A143DF84_9PROT|nr:chemotaxis protein CheW [Haematospirillum jordaniae]AMW35391.1 ATPase [Haematospirillum jordaniae]NKD46256.1 hybrid sensor histidine kinase/response regulator [Haematospirillum jordaniae]NKD56181.1 hybrid sensor histidine kinase/response regulator [Haematospirillum jordaniae]NKD58238.1 hybrid sensor histidine kinase/response regulator [Haematospirillum jordaniae]NKD66590.1 hybrid sensor histidine kinase/response regulator [Haematospirillum jordaniae]